MRALIPAALVVLVACGGEASSPKKPPPPPPREVQLVTVAGPTLQGASDPRKYGAPAGF